MVAPTGTQRFLATTAKERTMNRFLRTHAGRLNPAPVSSPTLRAIRAARGSLFVRQPIETQRDGCSPSSKPRRR